MYVQWNVFVCKNIDNLLRYSVTSDNKSVTDTLRASIILTRNLFDARSFRARKVRYLNNSRDPQTELANRLFASLTFGTIAFRVFRAIWEVVAHLADYDCSFVVRDRGSRCASRQCPVNSTGHAYITERQVIGRLSAQLSGCIIGAKTSAERLPTFCRQPKSIQVSMNTIGS